LNETGDHGLGSELFRFLGRISVPVGLTGLGRGWFVVMGFIGRSSSHVAFRFGVLHSPGTSPFISQFLNSGGDFGRDSESHGMCGLVHVSLPGAIRIHRVRVSRYYLGDG